MNSPKRGRALHVAEQDGHHPPLAAGRDQLRPVDQALDDARVDVLAEGLLDLRLEPELGHHGVEGAGEQADLVARGHRHHRVEQALLHGVGAGQQPPHRPRQAAREAAGDQKAQEPGKAGDHHHGTDDVGLAGLCGVGGGGHDPVELEAGLVDLAIVILALAVERRQQRAQAGRVGRGRQRLHQRGLPYRHVGAPLVDHLEQRVEAGEGHGVPEAGAAGQLCADRGPRRRQLALGVGGRLVGPPAQLIAGRPALAVADVDVQAADVERRAPASGCWRGPARRSFRCSRAPGPAARGRRSAAMCTVSAVPAHIRARMTSATVKIFRPIET